MAEHPWKNKGYSPLILTIKMRFSNLSDLWISHRVLAVCNTHNSAIIFNKTCVSVKLSVFDTFHFK